jgi:DNA ligase-1
MPLKPMLAKDADLAKLTFPVVVQPKLDGIRATVQDGAVYSRTLKRIPNAEVQATLGRPEFEGLDGEVIVGSPTAEDCYRQTSSFVMSESKRGADWCFVVFDAVESGLTTLPYSQRRTRLESLSVLWHVAEPNRVALVSETVAASLEELEAVEGRLVAEGHEGAILRVPSAAYKHGRSTPSGPLLKLKRFVDFEAVVLGVYEEQHNANVGFTNELGRTARSTAKDGKVGKGTLGGLIVRALNGPAEGVEFRVGTGFDAAQRESLWAESEAPPSAPPAAPRDGLNGCTAKIKSFPIGAKDKPRHPVFLGWRDLGVDGCSCI